MIKVWKEEKAKPKYFLKLIEDKEFKDKEWKDRATIIIVDEDGDRVHGGMILSFNEKGVIELHAGVNRDVAEEFGLTLGINDRVVLVNR